MSHFTPPDPPTLATIAEAKKSLEVQQQSLRELSEKIQSAQDTLSRYIRETQYAITEMEKERGILEEKVTITLAYISPIKRLPAELLREIFYFNFEEYPCCAWVLSAVCRMWRKLVLSMPILWSKIRLMTNLASSAETIRLWLERSGNSVPLDIEIFLRYSPSPVTAISSKNRRRVSYVTTQLFGDALDVGPGQATPVIQLAPVGGGAGHAATLVQVPQHHNAHVPQILHTANAIAASATGLMHTLTAQGPDDVFGMPPLIPSDRSSHNSKTRKAMHWGHITFYYLVEQMHRWERFVFRFDKQFSSYAALGAVEGDAPLLREFEVSCAEASFYPNWKWLPSAPPNTHDTSSLRSLTLHYVPFKWTSSVFHNLRTLNLRCLPNVHLAIDRILYIINQSPQLEQMSLSFASPGQPVLPLTPTTCPYLRSFNISGHYHLTALVEALILPALETLVFDVDTRDAVEDTVSALLARSGNPPLTRLSLAYGVHNTSFFFSAAGVTSWHFLSELDQLEILQVGSTPFEPLVAALSAPSEDAQQDRWMCPNLTTLCLRACHTRGDAVARLVQMVDARNPDLSNGGAPFAVGGVAPARLKKLEVHECSQLGPDVVAWLKTRVDEVSCSDPLFDRSPSWISPAPSPPYL